jgi:hypothetical protein
MSYAQRLQIAADLVREPSPLVEDFDASVTAFASYANPEAFYSNPKRAPKPPEPRDEIVKTHHVAWHLREQGVLDVDGTPVLKARYVAVAVVDSGALQLRKRSPAWVKSTEECGKRRH